MSPIRGNSPLILTENINFVYLGYIVTLFDERHITTRGS